MTYYLGDRYYRVRHDGMIEPKLVLSLPFKLAGGNFLSLEEALEVAVPRLKDILSTCDSISLKANLQKILDIFQDDLDTLRAAMEAVPIQFSNELVKLMGLESVDVDLTKIPAHDSYLQPGSMVFVAVTPSTHYTLSPSWRPAGYFVFRVRLTSVSWTKYGVRYDLDSHYRVHDASQVCSSLKEARTRLGELIIKQVPAVSLLDRKKMQYFSSKAEKKYWNDWNERQSKQRFGRLSAGSN